MVSKANLDLIYASKTTKVIVPLSHHYDQSLGKCIALAKVTLAPKLLSQDSQLLSLKKN